jgi:hypothetical protein
MGGYLGFNSDDLKNINVPKVPNVPGSSSLKDPSTDSVKPKDDNKPTPTDQGQGKTSNPNSELGSEKRDQPTPSTPSTPSGSTTPIGSGDWNQFIFEDPTIESFGNYAKITISVNQSITMNFHSDWVNAFTSTGLSGCKIELPFDSSQSMSDSVSVSWGRKTDSTTGNQLVEYISNTDSMNNAVNSISNRFGITGMNGESVRRFMTEDYNLGSLMKSIDVPFVIWQNKKMTPTKIKQGLGLLQGLVYPGLIGFMYPPSLTLSVGNLYRKLKANLASVDLQFDDGWRSLNMGNSGTNLLDDAFPIIIRGKLRFVNLFMYMWDALTDELTLKGKPWILFGDELSPPSSSSNDSNDSNSSNNSVESDSKKLGTPSDKIGNITEKIPMGLPSDFNIGSMGMNPDMMPGDLNFGNIGINGALSGMTGIGSGLDMSSMNGILGQSTNGINNIFGGSGLNPFGEGNNPFNSGFGGIDGILNGDIGSSLDFENLLQGGTPIDGIMNMDMSLLSNIQGNLPNIMDMGSNLGDLFPNNLEDIGIGVMGQISDFGSVDNILGDLMDNLDSKIDSIGGLGEFTKNLQNPDNLLKLGKLSTDNISMMTNTLQMRNDLSQTSKILKDLSNNTILKSVTTSSIINSLNGGLDNISNQIDNITTGNIPINPLEVKRLLGSTISVMNCSIDSMDRVGNNICQTCERTNTNKGLVPVSVIKNGIISSFINGSVSKDTKQVMNCLKGISSIFENSKDQIVSNKEENFVCQEISDTIKRNSDKIETKSKLIESQSNNILKRSSDLFRKGLGE